MIVTIPTPLRPRKVGNSMVVTIPADICEQLQLDGETLLQVTIEPVEQITIPRLDPDVQKALDQVLGAYARVREGSGVFGLTIPEEILAEVVTPCEVLMMEIPSPLRTWLMSLLPRYTRRLGLLTRRRPCSTGLRSWVYFSVMWRCAGTVSSSTVNSLMKPSS